MVGPHIDDFIGDPILYQSLHTLTSKEKEIINLAYINNLSDVQIGKILNKSQQAVSKMHKKALKKIYDYMTKEKYT
ncbi:sigma factor-like helix-turn-helix DNA-binding protein [Pseudobacillus badius]|uniref:sigma factor-like helix-turn-helix DNA-binding protein n=1 Tax=Bacillus badius TaxID=1455 RepID=UPI0024A05A18|nr:hypothetical protein Bbad01_38410 [Bacillus badius]